MIELPVLVDATDPSLIEVDEIPEDIVHSGNPTAMILPGPPVDGSRDVCFGIWTGEPGAMRSDGYPYDEVFVVTEGRVCLESSDGSSLQLDAGQTGYIPAGWKGVWHTLTPAKKTYFIAMQPLVGGPEW